MSISKKSAANESQVECRCLDAPAHLLAAESRFPANARGNELPVLKLKLRVTEWRWDLRINILSNPRSSRQLDGLLTD
jgi:hypothetical protein